MGTLTAEQLLIVRAAIAVDTNLTSELAKPEPDTTFIANYLNAASTFQVWRTTTPVADIQDQVLWANFTPANPIAGAGQDVTNWLLACQGKQFNLQNLLNAGGSSFNSGISTGKANIRAGLQDCCSQIPSGISGANKSGGWIGGIQLVIQRPATRLEKIFATGSGTSATPGDLVYEGAISITQTTGLVYNNDGTRAI